MTRKRLADLISSAPLSNPSDEETRRMVFALGRLTYEQGRLDALDQIHRMIER